jgi:hypothetical protein
MELSFVNRLFLKEAIILHNVIDCRRSQLEDIKQAFRDTGILKFMTNKPYLWDAAFASVKMFAYTPEMVLEKIEFEGEHTERLREFFSQLLQKLAQGKLYLSRLFICKSAI